MRAVFDFLESLISITCRVASVAFGTTEHNRAPPSHGKVTQSDTAFPDPPFQGTTRCRLSPFPRPDGQIARSGRPPNHKVRPSCARRLPTAPAGPPCCRETGGPRVELGLGT